MGWFFSDSPAPAAPFRDSQQPAPPNNLASDLKPASTDSKTEKVKPCCVCKDEKSARDECMLFSRADDPQEDCKGMVDKYRDCMRGFGFKVA
ncbi:Cytochrome c oxidase copper chaperone [Neophaeococcomyces mojaviensis]|uniref:Cytochrome c oxidase copper chaperone n=1 Tax=Neophaeococcomyces mojaviensis TaxID=3383035 RepID=A0ACC3AFC4_9EURO|nr:Cytochrome c oxidase copper chaperone [Knufia sp. JES_112]